MGRRKRQIGDKCPNGHTIAGQNIRVSGSGTVICRECNNEYMRERYRLRTAESKLSELEQVALIEGKIAALIAEKEQRLASIKAAADAKRAEQNAAARAVAERYPMPAGFPAARY